MSKSLLLYNAYDRWEVGGGGKKQSMPFIGQYFAKVLILVFVCLYIRPPYTVIVHQMIKLENCQSQTIRLHLSNAPCPIIAMPSARLGSKKENFEVTGLT